MNSLPPPAGVPAGSSFTGGRTFGTILFMLAQHAPLDAILTSLVWSVEEAIPEGICSIFPVDPSGTKLSGGVTVSLPAPVMQATAAVPLAGLLPEVTEVDSHPLWSESRSVLLEGGIRTCWLTPILTADQELMGLLTVHYRQIHSPGPSEQAAVTTAAGLTALALERERSRELKSRRLATVLHHMSDGVISVDTTGRLTIANAASQRLLGIFGPMEGRSLAEAGLPRPVADGLAQVATGEAQEHRTTVVVGMIHIELVVSPLETALGRRYGAVAILHDVTRQAQLRRLQESFIASASHELRAPLAALSAAIEALHDNVVPEDRRPRFLKAILSEIARMRNVSNQILALSRLDQGAVNPGASGWCLQPLLDDVAELWQARCKAEGLTLAVDTCDLHVWASYEYVQEILANLLDNAVKFTPGGGVIHVHAEPAGDQVRISVQDSGVGLQPAELDLVWERFYMGDAARTRNGRSGSGLGLALVKKLVEHMGGTVGVTSEPGKGASFFFTLPLAR